MTAQREHKPAGDDRGFYSTPFAAWLAIEPTQEDDVFRMRFNERHIGNPFIRALHGGVVGSMIEASAELGLGKLVEIEGESELVSSAIDYIRVTKDTDLFSRVSLVRIGRRLAFVEVRCWQDDEDTPIARGSCTLRIF